jgi:20S proteasome alpha/beta subunit
VTVCIGAIAGPIVIVASDRMITSGDIQFEQQQPKIFAVEPRALLLISGDIAVQTELVDRTRLETKAKRAKTVRDVANIYADAYVAYCRRKAEAAVLKPLGVESVEALMTKKKWSDALVSELLERVRLAAEDDGIATIVAGSDELGQHLYVIDRPGIVSTLDRIGFASVGIGQRHAESQFMFAGYTPSWKFPEALYLTYAAKRRAEVAPGVGRYTDLAVITPGPQGGIVPIDRDFIPHLQQLFDAEQAHLATVRDVSTRELEARILAILTKAPKPPEAPKQSDSVVPDAPPDQQAPPSTTHDPKDQPPSPE